MELSPPAVAGIAGVRTPALVIDLDAVEANVSATLALLGGDADRWRPHLKTAKLGLVMERLVARGITQAKVATPLELETACRAGFTDVLLAYPAAGPAVALVGEIARRYPAAAVSALVEDPAMVAAWRGGPVGLAIDLNAGMDRTGMAPEPAAVLALARAILAAGLRFAGLHSYEGHAAGFPAGDAEGLVHAGYDRVLALVRALAAAAITVPEVVTAGTPAFPHGVRYRALREAGIRHRLSPGTVVYNDRRSLTQLPAAAGYRPAAFVLSRVVSQPGPARFCLDAGHKSVSADAGDPTCAVLGHPAYQPRHPSEEHLPVDTEPGAPLPARGALFWLLPSHVCPTVNNFEHAVIVAGGKLLGVERVTARGRHPPLAV